MTTNTEIPAPIGSIEFERFLHKDPLGPTWRGLDRATGSKVDIRLLPEWVPLDDLRKWVSRVSAVTHRGLVRTLSLAVEGERAAVVTEFMDGETLFQRRGRRPRRFFEISEIKPWLKTLAEVIGHLHEQGITHGALHLGNVMVEGAELKVGDLAVSRVIRPTTGESRLLPLPPPAMSPQVLAGEPPSPADDVYALAVLVYDLLTGKPVFFSGDVTAQVQGVAPPSISERRRQLDIESAPVPEVWEKWIASSLDKSAAKRPPLSALTALLGAAAPALVSASGNLKAASSAPAVRSGHSNSSSGSKAPGRFRLTLNQWIMAAAAVVTLGLGTIIYTQQIAPKKAFKKQLDASFLAASQFDVETAQDHEAVIARWDSLLKEWQPRVSTEYPEFDPLLVEARAQRQAKLDQKQSDEKTALADATARLEARLKKARADYEVIRLDAAMRPNEREKLVEAWKTFLAQHDVDFEGKPLSESFGNEIAEAKKQLAEISQSLAAEKTLIETEITKTDGELARLRQLTADAAQPAAGKLTQVEALMDQISKQPRVVLKDARIEDLRKSADTLLVELKTQAEKETPKEPLDLQSLFVASACKDFSEPGRKRILQAAQAALKAQQLYQGDPDGGTGKGTHDAIIAFQKSKSLVPNAALDDRTLVALGLTELKDDATPLPTVASSSRRSGSSSRKPKEEPKSFTSKAVDGVKNVGKSIGSFFGGKKDKDKDKK